MLITWIWIIWIRFFINFLLPGNLPLYGIIFQFQKSILDAELDLIAKENQGVDTEDLKKSVAILKSQVK